MEKSGLYTRLIEPVYMNVRVMYKMSLTFPHMTGYKLFIYLYT